MSEKKKPSKKSLEYVRPPMGCFDLKKFPGVVFTFRKVELSDNPWCQKHLGAEPWGIINTQKTDALTLCRLYFHFLTEESQAYFPATKEIVKDDDTGVEKEELITRPMALMRAIDGGSIVELMLVANAFMETLMKSRSYQDLPESLKKSLEDLQEKKAKREAPSIAPPAEARTTVDVGA